MSYSALGQTVTRLGPGGVSALRAPIPWGAVAIVGGLLAIGIGAMYLEHQMRESVRRSAGDEGLAAYDMARIARSLVMNRRPTRRRR